MPQVSVIVPNYNHAPYLKQRIDSILNQTFRDFELILLDDCSTDNSREIIEQYRTNPNVTHIIYNTENSGSTFHQWNKGINSAKGEYIWIAESDDWADSNFLKELISKMELHRQAGIAFCYSYRIDEKGNILPPDPNTFFDPPGNNSEYQYYSGISFLKNRLLTGNAIYNAGMAVFKKELFLKIDFAQCMAMKYCGDWLFWSLLCEKTDVMEVNQKYNYFRTHHQNVSSNAERTGLAECEGITVSLHNLKHFSDDKALIKKIYKYWGARIYFKKYPLKTLMSVLHNIRKQKSIICVYFMQHVVLCKINSFFKLFHKEEKDE